MFLCRIAPEFTHGNHSTVSGLCSWATIGRAMFDASSQKVQLLAEKYGPGGKQSSQSVEQN